VSKCVKDHTIIEISLIAVNQMTFYLLDLVLVVLIVIA